MNRAITKQTSILLTLLFVMVFVPCMGMSANAQEISEDLDLCDTTIFDTVGSGVVTRKTADDGSAYYEFLGGGTNTYNKLITKKSYGGDITLTYDILFESTENAEMVFVTPRGTYSDSTAVHFPSSITSNFVLHTDSSGQRLSVTNGSGTNSRSATADSTMSTAYSDKKTGNWYSVKLVITNDAYQAKFWPADGQEPESFNCTLSAATDDPSEGVIGIAKRGSGKVLLRNWRVTYTQADENAVYSFVETPKALRVLAGTPASALALPDTVSVELSDGTKKDVPVTWDTSAYQADAVGTCVLNGILQGTQAENPANLTASIDITTYSYAYTDTLTKAAGSWNGNSAGVFEEDEEGVITLGGGGTEKYNKILSDDSYIGDIRLQFDVKFSSDANAEMLSFTPRMNPISMDTSKYKGVCGNFVLHTSDSKGLRLSNNGSTQITDKTISNKQLSATDVWYTVCFEISGNAYRLEFYPADGAETDGSGWMEYTLEQGATTGMIAFQKRGSGSLSLRNVTVAYNEKSVFSAESVISPDSVRVPYNTPWSDLGLPETVEVNGVGNSIKSVEVTWNESDYSTTATGMQTITGTLHLPQAQNPDGVKAEIEVIVLSQSALYHTAKVWTNGELENVSVYHQFGTITTSSGTILATCEARVGGSDCDNPSSIVLKRSTDGGMTWGETIVVADYAENKCSDTENDCEKGEYGHFFANPTPVVDYSSGAIYLFYSENFGNASSKLYYKVSRDDGITWSLATEVTSLFADDPYEREFHLAGPGHGLQIENGAYVGRLVVEVWHRHAVTYAGDQRQYGLSVLYSDDGGSTWKNSEYIEVGHNMNEGRVAQLADGKLVINSRSTDNKRRQTFSTDGGAHWSVPVAWSSIGTYGNCDSGFTSQVDSNQTQLITTHIKNETTVRNTLYAFLSYDDGETWEYSALLWDDPSVTTGTGASDVNRISKDTYGTLHGTCWNGNDVEFIVFNTEYLTGVSEKTTPDAPAIPELESLTESSIVVKAVVGLEYRLDSGAWQKSNIFTNLNAGTTYRITARVAETETAYASASSDALVVCTDSDSGYSSDPSYTIRVETNKNGTVTANRKKATAGTRIILTIIPDEGYVLKELIATDSKGNAVSINEKNGKYTFRMPAGGVSVSAIFAKVVGNAENPFSDVAVNDYYYDAVLWATENGIIDGIAGGLFGGDLSCTRGQIVTFLWRAAGCPEPKGTSGFNDVSTNSLYAKAVSWAVENGITTGVGSNSFAPEMACTRAQAVTFLFRALGALTGDKASFSDVAEQAWYAEAVAWAEKNGVTGGIGGGLFGGDLECTRAQIVTLLYRAYK